MGTVLKMETKQVFKTHKTQSVLTLLLKKERNVYLVGPAGSGKTMAAQSAADSLGLKFYCTSVCAQTSKADLFGFVDATGTYRPTPLYIAYTEGGVYLMDEVDNGNSNTNNAMNAALSGMTASFPCGMVTRHKDFYCIVAGNTYGTGASRQYVGRNQLDAAFLDRFAMLEWDYDHDMENDLVKNKKIAKLVQAIRAKVSDLKIKLIVSPRASMGIDAVHPEIDIHTALDLMLFKGQVDKATKEKILSEVEKEIKKLELPKPGSIPDLLKDLEGEKGEEGEGDSGEGDSEGEEEGSEGGSEGEGKEDFSKIDARTKEKADTWVKNSRKEDVILEIMKSSPEIDYDYAKRFTEALIHKLETEKAEAKKQPDTRPLPAKRAGNPDRKVRKNNITEEGRKRLQERGRKLAEWRKANGFPGVKK